MTTVDTIKIVVIAVTMATTIFIAEDIFVLLVKLNRRIRLKRTIRKFRNRDKPVHVSTLKETK